MPTLSVPFVSIAIDVLLIVVILVCTFNYARKGFAAGVIILLGNAVSLVCAYIVSKYASVFLFDKIFQASLESKTVQVISAQGIFDLEQLLRSLLSFLPVIAVESLVGKYGTSLDMNSENLAKQVVGQVIKPLIVPIISAIIFVFVFVMLRILFRALRNVFVGVNRIPVLGSLNKALGAVIGVLIGILYVIVIMFVAKLAHMGLGENSVIEPWISQGFMWKIAGYFNIATF